MKKFLLYIVIVLLGIIGVDALFSFVIKKTISSGTILSLEGNNNLSSDIMVIGASRAIRHYDPQLLSKRLKCNVSVLGRPSENIFFNYAIFKVILEKTDKKPSIVLLEISESDINSKPNKSNSDELNVLYPLYYSESSIKEVLSDVLDKKELFFVRFSGLYRNNSKLLSYIKPVFKGEPTPILYGYLPLKNVWTKPIEEKVEVGDCDSAKIKYLEQFMELCERENIKLVLVMSPGYRILKGTQWKETVQSIARERNIPIIDHEQDSVFIDHQEWFYDSYHLNETGAVVYCNTIAEELMQNKNLK